MQMILKEYRLETTLSLKFLKAKAFTLKTAHVTLKIMTSRRISQMVFSSQPIICAPKEQLHS
jgi:hypothetical protein